MYLHLHLAFLVILSSCHQSSNSEFTFSFSFNMMCFVCGRWVIMVGSSKIGRGKRSRQSKKNKNNQFHILCCMGNKQNKMIFIWKKMPWSVIGDEDDWGPRSLSWGWWRSVQSSAACLPSPVRPTCQPLPGQQDRLQVPRNPGMVTVISHQAGRKTMCILPFYLRRIGITKHWMIINVIN